MKKRNLLLTILLLVVAVMLYACGDKGKNEPVVEKEEEITASAALTSLKSTALNITESVGENLSQLKIRLNLDAQAKDYSRLYFNGELLKAHVELAADAILEDPTNFGSLKAAAKGQATLNGITVAGGEAYFAYSALQACYKLIDFEKIDLTAGIPATEAGVVYEESYFDQGLPLGMLVTPELIRGFKVEDILSMYLPLFESNFAEFVKFSQIGQTIKMHLSLNNDNLGILVERVLDLVDPFKFDASKYEELDEKQLAKAREDAFVEWEEERRDTIFGIFSMASVNQFDLVMEIYQNKAITISASFDLKIASFGGSGTFNFSMATEGAEVNINPERTRFIKAKALEIKEREEAIEAAVEKAEELRSDWIQNLEDEEKQAMQLAKYDVYINGFKVIFGSGNTDADEDDVTDANVPGDVVAAGWAQYSYSAYTAGEYNTVIFVVENEQIKDVYMITIE